MSDKMAKILNDVLAPTQGMETQDLVKYLSMLCTVSLTVLRGAAGDEFVMDYLNAAIDDDSKPEIKIMNQH